MLFLSLDGLFLHSRNLISMPLTSRTPSLRFAVLKNKYNKLHMNN